MHNGLPPPATCQSDAVEVHNTCVLPDVENRLLYFYWTKIIIIFLHMHYLSTVPDLLLYIIIIIRLLLCNSYIDTL